MSVLAINNNTLAYNSANILQGHYSRLATSTERLSTGLRINSAADDAAGLAIRELMRADISALRQGARNVNDAISMLQTTDGALSVIDEKLIRMKELAEQAATGTYDSTQRLMIASEFQAMGDEINRIARATDFNGIKLLDGQTTGAPVVINANGIMTLASANLPGVSGPGDKKYDISLNDSITNAQLNATVTEAGTGWDLSGITNPGALVGNTNITISNDGAIKFGDRYLLVTPQNYPTVPAGTQLTMSFNINGINAQTKWSIQAVSQDGRNLPVTINRGDNGYCRFSITDGTNTQAYDIEVYDPITSSASDMDASVPPQTWTAPANDTSFTSSMGQVTANMTGGQLSMTVDLGNGNTISNAWDIRNGNGLALSGLNISLNVKDVTPAPPNPGPDPGPGPVKPPYTGDDPNSPLDPDYVIPDDVVRIHFGSGADSREDFYDIRKHDATLKGLGLDGVNIQTQDAAQNALVSIRDAIVTKDKIRAEYGAMQNRLENTLTNVTVQAENLQAAESRLSDVNVATEMSNFVRNQVLTQSALAMLSQANSIPQMVMSLIR